MKIQALVSAIFLAKALAQSTPRDEYEQVCPERNGQTGEINPGYYVKYQCDFLAAWSEPAHVGITNPRECAALCEETEGCTGTTWAWKHEKCVLSGDLAAQEYPGGLYMQRVNPSDPLADPEDPLAPDACAACNSDLESCRAQVALLEANQVIQCSASNQKTVIVGGKKYKIHCAKGTHVTPNDIATTSATTLKACVQACANRSACKQALWSNAATKKCFLRSQTPPGNLEISRDTYETAVLVE